MCLVNFLMNARGVKKRKKTSVKRNLELNVPMKKDSFSQAIAMSLPRGLIKMLTPNNPNPMKRRYDFPVMKKRIKRKKETTFRVSKCFFSMS